MAVNQERGVAFALDTGLVQIRVLRTQVSTVAGLVTLAQTLTFALLFERAFLMTDHSGNVNVSTGGFTLSLGLLC